MKIIETNKKAYFDYFVEETIEAGIELKGSEVKSVKQGNVSLRDSFCRVENGEMWLKNAFIAPYEKGSHFNAEERRDRKLLLHRREIDKLLGKVQQKGFTLVPTKIYFLANKVKVEIGLCKGKQLHDKRDVKREKDVLRSVERELKNYK